MASGHTSSRSTGSCRGTGGLQVLLQQVLGHVPGDAFIHMHREQQRRSSCAVVPVDHLHKKAHLMSVNSSCSCSRDLQWQLLRPLTVGMSGLALMCCHQVPSHLIDSQLWLIRLSVSAWRDMFGGHDVQAKTRCHKFTSTCTVGHHCRSKHQM